LDPSRYADARRTVAAVSVRRRIRKGKESMQLRRAIKKQLWTVCALSLAFGGGCGNDDSKEATCSIDQSLDLDYTDDPDGRPEDLPGDVDEIYTPSEFPSGIC